MSFEQKRNAERLPLDEPIEGTASGLPVKVVELSAIGGKIEHKEKLTIGSATTLRFVWRKKAIELRGKVARTQMRSAYPQGMYYETGLKFADSLDDAPEALREMLASITEPAIEEPPAPTAGEDTLRRLRLATERDSTLPIEAFAPVEPPPPDFDLEEAEVESSGVALAVEPEPESEIEPEPEPEPEPQVDYVECRLENGVWHRRIVHALLQPEEGFITVPADDKELQMLCKTYEYADPETRRLIRISLELAATNR